MATEKSVEKKPRERRAARIDRKKVAALAEQGVSHTDIAKHQGVNQSTISRFLDKVSQERQAVERFKSCRADVLATMHAKTVDLQQRILDGFDDGVLAALTATQKSSLLFALNATAGTTFDKERLERGQSTQNHSLITKMMGPALKDAGKLVSMPNDSP